jgi:hypothetical protein
MDDPEFWAKDW